MIPRGLRKRLIVYSLRVSNLVAGYTGYGFVCSALKGFSRVHPYLDAGRRKAVKKNFLMLRGSLEGWERTFHYYWSTVADSLMIPHVDENWLKAKLLRVEGLEELERFRGKPLIVISAHLGNPDVLANFAGVLGFKGVAVAEVPSGEWFREFLKIRERFGVKIIPAKKSYQRLVDYLRRGEGFVYLVSDRLVTKERGAVVRMGKGYRRIPTGFARLSLETGVPILFGYGVPVEPCGKYVGFISPPVKPRSLEEGIEWFAGLLETAVKEWTDRWFVFQDEWLDRVDGRDDAV